jgi:hypothetical protein
MRLILICSLIAIAAVAERADAQQAPAAGRTSQPRDMVVAPEAPKKVPEAQAPSAGASAGVPTNICRELLAFVQANAQQQASDQQPATAPQQSGQSPKPPAPQSGQSSQAPATQSGESAGPGQSSPPVDRSQQASGQSAPIPGDDKVSTQVDVTPAQAEALVKANDLKQCQGAVRDMRRAGVEMPHGLIALGALREDLLMRAASAP